MTAYNVTGTNVIDGSRNTTVVSLGVGTTASGTSGEIRATNNITAYFSDERLKENLGVVPDALTKIKSLSGFYFKNNELANSFGYTSDKVQIGISAQAVQAAYPELVVLAPFDSQADEAGNIVSISGNDYLTVDYAKLVPVLIEAIKELSAEIEKLKQAK
jgi:trimeric autotransporter adhesin